MMTTAGQHERRDLVQYSITWFLNGHRSSLLASLLFTSVLCLGCSGPAPLTVDMPLHLEDHLDVATIVGSEVPEDRLRIKDRKIHTCPAPVRTKFPHWDGTVQSD